MEENVKKEVKKKKRFGRTHSKKRSLMEIQELELSMLDGFGDNLENIEIVNDNNEVKSLKNKNTNKKIANTTKNNSKNTNAVKKSNTLTISKKNDTVNGNKKTKQNKTQKPAQALPPLNIIPLGGLGEVGKNITVIECLNDMFVMDCGLLFPDTDLLGIDLVIPDFTFIVENISKIKGLIVTHGHEDHIGAIPYLLKQVNLPIYATKLTIGLIKNKLKEHKLLDSAKLIEIKTGEILKLGCFKIEPILVNHSIPDAVGFAIDSPAGLLVHTGDFKVDYTPLSGKPIDLARFSHYGDKGVLALMSDSTNAERPGSSMSERKVGESFARLFNQAGNKRIIIATFASNIQRVQEILSLAKKYGRKVAVSGRSMVNNTEMAMELGYLNADKNLLIDIEAVNKYPPEQIVIVTTGSQGESLSALARMSHSSHRNVKLGDGDFIIISAKPIPGNEKMVSKVVNSLMKLGTEVIYESMYDIHTSGHAYNDEQILMLNLVRPKFFIPVHGEFKHLTKHSALAQGIGVPKENIYIAENGEVISVTNDKIQVTNTVTSGGVYVDGIGVGDVGNVVLHDRKILSEDGLVIVAATMDAVSGEVISGPDILSRGFVYVKESEDLMRETREAVNDVFEQCYNDNITESNTIKSRIREKVSQLMWKKTKRNPMVLALLMEV